MNKHLMVSIISRLYFVFLFTPLFVMSQNLVDIDLALKIHNKARSSLGITSLEWSSKLADEASLYAKTLAINDNGLIHSNNNSSGENLYMICCYDNDSEFKFILKNASEAWYDEVKDYKYGPIKSYDTKMIGHYTQMIWLKTKLLGIGYAVSSKGAIYVVARYFPAGNYIGQYPY